MGVNLIMKLVHIKIGIKQILPFLLKYPIPFTAIKSYNFEVWRLLSIFDHVY